MRSLPFLDTIIYYTIYYTAVLSFKRIPPGGEYCARTHQILPSNNTPKNCICLKEEKIWRR